MLFTFRDKINKMPYSNLVYKFNCNIYNDIYYGKTKHHFKVFRYHSINRVKVKSSKESAVFDHIFRRVMTQVLIILKPLSKSLMKLDSCSESCFWYCVMIHLGTHTLGDPPGVFLITVYNLVSLFTLLM